jgi:hypothetical protein
MIGPTIVCLCVALFCLVMFGAVCAPWLREG